MKINEGSIARGQARLRELGHPDITLSDFEEALKAANKSGQKYPHRFDTDMLANLEQLNMLVSGAVGKYVKFTAFDRDGERYRSSRIHELQYWGLATPSGDRDGCWALTQKGHDFLHSDLKIPNKIYTIDSIQIEELPRNTCNVNYAAVAAECTRKRIEALA